MTGKPQLDTGATAIALAALGFGVVLLLAPQLSADAIQPILALVLAAAGAIGLILSRRRTPRSQRSRKQRKDT